MNLADNGDNNEDETDMLIGADMYWKVVTGNIKKDGSTGVTAICSMFGWLINGPVTDRPEKSIHVSVPSTQCEKGGDKMLSEQISKFGDLHLVGIKNEGQSRDDTTGNISFERGIK